MSPDSIAIIGGGPAGLMAAEGLAAAGHPVTVFDAKPSVGRKFLLAGKGGLNLTHGEPLPAFRARDGARADAVGRRDQWCAAVVRRHQHGGQPRRRLDRQAAKDIRIGRKWYGHERSRKLN